MSLLYLICLLDAAIGWYFDGIMPVDVQGTEIVIPNSVPPRWHTLVAQTTYFSMAVIADVLMVGDLACSG